jgi:hypothetical protein
MRRMLPLVVVLFVALVPGRAVAATVVNGDFESGTLNGWQAHSANEAGNWFAYQGTAAPFAHSLTRQPLQPPPQGTYGAISEEADPDSLTLSQELTVPAGTSSQLSLLAYYNSYEPIAVPTPDTLSVSEEVLGGQQNQQFRIDVMRVGAPLESLEPSDILLNVFQTVPGAKQVMKPTKLTADLTPFAGQTVTLRITVAANQEVFNAGIDEVQISSPGTGSSGSGGSRGSGSSRGPDGSAGGKGAAGRITFGKAKVDPRNGTVALPVRVPAAGVLRARGAALPGKGESKHGAPAVRATGAPATRGGTVVLHLVATGAAWAILKRQGLLRTSVTVSYTPKGGGELLKGSEKVALRLSSRER